MRKVILNVAVSLDGFIEGPKGEYDWCFTDQDYGMTDFFNRIDSVFMGRKSYELTQGMTEEQKAMTPKFKEYIFSNTLQEVENGAIIIRGDIQGKVKDIKSDEGKDIWLFGGASLTESFIKLGLVDEVFLAVHPIILGGGKPLFKGVSKRTHLKLKESTPYSSGLVILKYSFGDT